jgi:quinol monooxygenase YgiN
MARSWAVLASLHHDWRLMIFIVVKFTVHPDRAEEWLGLADEFTQATRGEPGNIMFEWSRSVDTPNQFVLVEAFEGSEAGAAHVGSDHFKAALAWMPDLISKTPEIINAEVPGTGWSQMAELSVGTRGLRRLEPEPRRRA